MGQQVCCFDLEHEREEESDLKKIKEWEPMDWEIREWYTELRENDITMHEINMKRASQRKKPRKNRKLKKGEGESKKLLTGKMSLLHVRES